MVQQNISFTKSFEILKYRWDLLQPFQVDIEVSQKVFFDLLSAYSSSDRFYHTLAHIQQVLETIEKMRLANNFLAIQMAAWFHDVIYDPKAKDNEEKSAEYATAALNKLKIPITAINRVINLILTTQNHQPLPDDIDSKILLDADLSILGSTESEYIAYAKAIRQEYSWVGDVEYQVGRKQVLQNFLQRERIYFTTELFSTLEIKARQNIQAEIAALK